MTGSVISSIVKNRSVVRGSIETVDVVGWELSNFNGVSNIFDSRWVAWVFQKHLLNINMLK